MRWGAYLRLIRMDKPVGTLLLWFPTAWALWSAGHRTPPWAVAILFALGTFIMRSAGCIMNDIADRQIDKHVTRTKTRPLTSGEINLTQALGLLAVLLSIALFILFFLPPGCFMYAILSVAISMCYPFCKRFIQAPQLVLGIAFSMGMPMAYAALGAPLDRGFLILWCINFLWIIAYDSMYAMVDKADDLKIGIHSTAIFFGRYEVVSIGVLLVLSHGLWLVWARLQGVNSGFYWAWIIACGLICEQIINIQGRDEALCFRAFKSSMYYGMLMWIGVIVGL